jgi:hypothetical protein
LFFTPLVILLNFSYRVFGRFVTSDKGSSKTQKITEMFSQPPKKNFFSTAPLVEFLSSLCREAPGKPGFLLIRFQKVTRNVFFGPKFGGIFFSGGFVYLNKKLRRKKTETNLPREK